MACKKITYDSIRKDVFIENGQLFQNMRPFYKVPNGETDVAPKYVTLYYDQDDSGFCVPITEEEYFERTFYYPSSATTSSPVEVEVIDTYESAIPDFVQYPNVPALNYNTLFYSPCTLNSFNFSAPPIVPVTPAASPESNETDENITGINGNFSLHIMYRNFYISHTSSGTTKKITFSTEIKTSDSVFYYEVAGTDYTDPRWISDASDHKAYLTPGKKSLSAFIQYMQLLTADTTIPEKYIFDNCGWEIINGKPCYIYADGVIGAQIPNVFGNPIFHICFDSSKVGSTQIFEETKKILSITHDSKISSTLFLYLHTGTLTSLFDEAKFPVKFLVAILGQTNSRKTSLAQAILRLFNTDDPTPEVSFSSTPGGLEIMMSQYADTILIIDDYMPATNRSRQNLIDNKFDDIARRTGDHTIKHRMSDFADDKNISDYPSRGCYVITGEQMHGVQSALARTVVVNLSKNEVKNDVLQFFQDNIEIVPTHLVDFIRYTAAHYWEIIDYIHKKLPVYRRRIKTRIARLAEAFAVFAVTSDILCSYISDRKFMNESDVLELKNFFTENVLQIILQNDLQFVASDPGILILTALSDAILSGNYNIISRSEYTIKSEAILEDDTAYYIRSETAYLITKNYCAKYDIPIALINPKAVIPALEQLNVLILSSTSKERARKLPNNQKDSRRYLYINKEKMAEILSDSEDGRA